MNRGIAGGMVSLVAILLVGANDPPSPSASAIPRDVPPPADFKLVIQLFSLAKDPIATAELIVHEGVAYHFINEVPEEVLIIDPRQARVRLFDWQRQVQTEFSARRLDSTLERLHRKLTAVAEKQEATGERAKKITATMTRNLIDPHFQETYDPKTRQLRLTNPTTEIVVQEEPEPDAARRLLILNCLSAIAKVGALRDPDIVPPFTRLEALRRASARERTRPAEVAVVYRLAGPPKKLRWTYTLVPALTVRENEALQRVNTMRAKAVMVPYERYEEVEKP